MSWSYTANKKFPLGHNGKYLITGTFTDGATAGQTIVTGLSSIEYCSATSTTAAACGASASGGTLTIVVTNNGTDDGFWEVIGR